MAEQPSLRAIFHARERGVRGKVFGWWDQVRAGEVIARGNLTSKKWDFIGMLGDVLWGKAGNRNFLKFFLWGCRFPRAQIVYRVYVRKYGAEINQSGIKQQGDDNGQTYA